MPIMDGVEACIKIKQYLSKQANSKIPQLFALTSENDLSELKRIQQAGFLNVFSFLDQIAIREILKSAGLGHKPKN